ncbi:hypothetical protein CDEST_04446 [Colletotrichum destructivum]|uniref:Peptidase A1 domain-containing protein n=1 Tax=Colletotrichum destructivum TaxID=34406 RepID=A0AAX4I7S7_9PEZI|nr:hypothetical protein CDEST_04446 [Colletotrichum destructivum]
MRFLRKLRYRVTALLKLHGTAAEDKGKAVVDNAPQDKITKSLDNGSEKHDVLSTSPSVTTKSTNISSPFISSPGPQGEKSEDRLPPSPVEPHPIEAIGTYGPHPSSLSVGTPHSVEPTRLQIGASSLRSFLIPSPEVYQFPQTNVWCGRPAQVPVPEDLRTQWDKDGGFKHRLKLDLQPVEHAMKRYKPNSNIKKRERIFVLELRMSGYASGSPPRSVTLNPCIWILCGSDWGKKLIKKALKDLSWTASFIDRPIEVQQGIPEWAAAPSLIPLEQLQLDASSRGSLDLPGYKIMYHIDSGDVQSYSGLLCCATLLRDGEVIDQQTSRIGGFLVGTAMTTAHGVLERFLQDLEPGVASDASDNGTTCPIHVSSGSTSPFNMGPYSDSGIESGSDSESDSGSNSFQDGDENGKCLLGFKDPSKVERWTPVSFVGSNLMGNIINHGSMSSTSSRMLDYALLEHSQPFYIPLGACFFPTNPVESYTSNKDLSAGPVWLLFSDSLMIKGIILDETQLMPFLGKSLPTRKIQLSAPLGRFTFHQKLNISCNIVKFLTFFTAPGTSGTWLVRDESLCGMIIARYPGEPLALFITAEDILRDISSSFPFLVDWQFGTKVASRSLRRPPERMRFDFQLKGNSDELTSKPFCRLAHLSPRTSPEQGIRPK